MSNYIASKTVKKLIEYSKKLSYLIKSVRKLTELIYHRFGFVTCKTLKNSKDIKKLKLANQ